MKPALALLLSTVLFAAPFLLPSGNALRLQSAQPHALTVPAAELTDIPAPANDSNEGRRYSGPFTHANLTIYLVHGADAIEVDKDQKKFAEARETPDDYIKALSPVIDGDADAIGIVFAINSRTQTVCATRAQFVELCPKLLKAAAAEAIAGQQKNPKSAPINERD